MPQTNYFEEPFTPEERGKLAPFVTNLDGPVFALRNLPETTCAALFARYSRSPKSLRRLLLDEFLSQEELHFAEESSAGLTRASDLFGRVLAEYGDDSVSQLAGVHLACEQVSQPMTKIIEWGRLAGYLEQSTRYIPYTDKRDDRYRYYVPPELSGALKQQFEATMDFLFDTYVASIDAVVAHLDTITPQQDDTKARQRALRAVALDLVRGLLPAATVSNVGVFTSPQTLEQMIMRMRAHHLPEARAYAEMIAEELRKIIPDFLNRLDRDDRGGAWVDYWKQTRLDLANSAHEIPPSVSTHGVKLIEWDAQGENKIIAAALFPFTNAEYTNLVDWVEQLPLEEKQTLFDKITGPRGNRRHKPGRGFEHSDYVFEITSGYGEFRDLQRHRMLTLQWQELSTSLGYEIPEQVVAAGADGKWREGVARAEQLYEDLKKQAPDLSQYAVLLCHNMRYLMKLNAREAMHMLELRTSPQGHAAYRQICQEMHRQIDEVAGHHLVANSMQFMGQGDVHLPRYDAEVKAGARQ